MHRFTFTRSSVPEKKCFPRKRNIWNISSKFVKWNEETITFWAVRLLELDSWEFCPGHSFHLIDAQMEAQDHPPTLWQSRLDPGVKRTTRRTSMFCTSSRTLTQGAAGVGEKAYPVKCWLTLPWEPSRFSASLAPSFSKNLHSVDTLYPNLCLWFDEVREETNLKLVFMSVNILLPRKRHGFFMQLTGLMFSNLEIQWGILIFINCYINNHEECRIPPFKALTWVVLHKLRLNENTF